MNGGASVVIKPDLAERFQVSWIKCRIFLFSAPCGVGKTTAALTLLKNRTVWMQDASEPDFISADPDFGCEVILIDNLQAVRDSEEQQRICGMILEHPDNHFVFLSRSALPGWLIHFQLAGMMCIFEEQDMLFDRRDISYLMEESGIAVTHYELTAIQNDTKGYPLAVSILARHMRGGRTYNGALVEETRNEIFRYFEEAVYRRFDSSLCRLLLDLAPFDSFDLEMAMIVSGDSHAGALLGWIMRETSMLMIAESGNREMWSFRPVFRGFLRWELEQTYSEDEKKALYSRAALYYELNEEYGHALECYTRCGEHRKISELLIKNAEMHPGVGHYYEMEKYYRALPKSEILNSPVLMAGMSMMSAMLMEYEESENWYKELKEFAAKCRRTDADYKEAKKRIAYLDIALPQRSSDGLADVIAKIFAVMKKRHINLPDFSVTSMLPSIMNGGKDFCNWSKKDDFLYATLRPAVEAVLGRDGVGLPECAIAESKFEKGENISERLLGLFALLGEVQRKGTPDIEFALVGLLVRAQCDQGRAAEAKRTLEALRIRFLEEGGMRFIPNIDAMMCRIHMRLNDMDAVEEWRREKSPKDMLKLRGMLRYQYVTLAMTEIVRGEYDSALFILAPLDPYCRECGRIMDALHLRILSAICYYRQQNEAWRENLDAALDVCMEYSFIRPISGYGAAVLPMLTACGWNAEPAFLERIISAARTQAVNYPDFLRCRPKLFEPLSQAEMQVLRLLCYDRSNGEIGEILGIKLSTVKTHVSSILQKLNVSRRSEAKAAAEKLGLI